MPSSYPGGIPYVVEAVIELAPKSVLEIGVGFGK